MSYNITEPLQRFFNTWPYFLKRRLLYLKPLHGLPCKLFSYLSKIFYFDCLGAVFWYSGWFDQNVMYEFIFYAFSYINQN